MSRRTGFEVLVMQLDLASPKQQIVFGSWTRPRSKEQADPVEGRIAHDLRNILNIISGNLSLVSRTLSDDSPARKHIERAMAGVELGTRLAGSALRSELSQIRPSAGLDIGTVATSLEAIVRDAAGRLVDLDVRIPDDLPKAAVDKASLENVLINLAVNARHAMNDVGALRVTFEEILEEGRHWILLTVTDTGCGMSQSVIDRAFEPYFSTKGTGGTGLGLASVKRFADECGGSVVVQSAIGAGTTISIRLPTSAAVN